MNRSPLKISCATCGFSFMRGDLGRSCSNCFACTGCEIYICPGCNSEIVVKPIGKPGERQAARRSKGLESGNR